jgi:hypothetical protein
VRHLNRGIAYHSKKDYDRAIAEKKSFRIARFRSNETRRIAGKHFP